MRAVLDTNVVVSGTMTSHGTCSRILEVLTEGMFEICADDRILDEYDSVLRRPELDIDPRVTISILELIRSTALLVAAPPLAMKLPDPDDLAFLEVAAAAEAVLVTGNLRHFPRPARCGVAVITPREFLAVLGHSA